MCALIWKRCNLISSVQLPTSCLVALVYSLPASAPSATSSVVPEVCQLQWAIEPGVEYSAEEPLDAHLRSVVRHKETKRDLNEWGSRDDESALLLLIMQDDPLTIGFDH